MVSLARQSWVRHRRCDAPDCENDSLPEHTLVAHPAIGPVLDIPLRLFFCHEHRDVGSLLDRYLAAGVRPLVGSAGRISSGEREGCVEDRPVQRDPGPTPVGA